MYIRSYVRTYIILYYIILYYIILYYIILYYIILYYIILYCICSTLWTCRSYDWLGCKDRNLLVALNESIVFIAHFDLDILTSFMKIFCTGSIDL